MKIIKSTIIFLLLSAVQSFSQEKNFNLSIEIENIEDCDLVLSRFVGRIHTLDTFRLTKGVANLSLNVNDTTLASISVRSMENSFDNPRGNRVYPHFGVLVAPNESQVIKARIELKKPPVVSMLQGNGIARDYATLYYDILQPLEQEYKQLVINNIIAAGDIQQYEKEYESYTKSTRDAIAQFNEDFPNSYITLLNFNNFYNSYDENHMEAIFDSMPASTRNSMVGRYFKRRLDMGRNHRIGSIASDFTRTALTGEQIKLSDFLGSYVLLDFWGSWCSPCRASHPHLVELYQKYNPKGLVMIGIAQESGRDIELMREKWSTAVKEDGLPWIQVLENDDKTNSITRSYNITSVPTKVIISPEGKIIARYTGNSDTLDTLLESLFM